MKKKSWKDRIITTQDLPDASAERPNEKLMIVTTNPKGKKKSKFSKQIVTTADVEKEEKE